MAVRKTIIRKARKLFFLNAFDGKDALVTTFENLGAELFARSIVPRQTKRNTSALEKILPLANSFRYASMRLVELLARLSMIEWMVEVLCKSSGKERSLWNIYLGLAIKDFHMDISSLMDSMAPAVIQTTGKIKPQDKKDLPGFADIQKGTKRSYRDEIPSDLLKSIDSAEKWWPAVKKIRNILIHRDHETIIFGSPSDGLLFQIYEGIHDPKVLEASLLHKAGKNVVDFSLYSAFVIAEALVLLDELGEKIASHLNITEEGLTGTMVIGDYKSIIVSFGRLLKAKPK